MPNLRGKTWTTTTPANVGDAQYWEDHLISDEAAQKAAGAVQSVNNTLPDENGNINITPSPLGPTVVDSLNSTSATDALSANQGHALKDLVDTLTEDTQELKYRVGILSTPVPAYVARCTPPRFKNVTDDWENGTLRDEIAAGNFKNVVPCDYLKYDNTYIWFAEPDGMLGKGDQTNATYQAQAYGQHHIYAMVKYMGDTRLWAGYGNANKSWHVSANDKGKCPWNAATDVDPTDSEAIGTNSTNITRTYNSANESGYMGSFIRERMDAVILPYLQTLLGSANILLFRNINGNAVVTDKPSGGQGNWNGCTSGLGWYDRYLDLPSEVEIYGSRVFGSAYDIGAQCEQLAMFKNARIHDIFPRIDIWTKAVASSSYAASRATVGSAYADGASNARWACPLVCIR